LAAKWEALLPAGLPIEELNRRRAGWSALKDGRLGKLLLERTTKIRVWVLADTDPATAPATVGSGPLHAEGIPHHVLASSNDLVAAAGLRLGAAGWSVYRFPDRVAGDTEAEARRFIAALHRLDGNGIALVGGGEPLVRLPANAPPGGRCPHAALAAARELREGELFLAAASDGVDGTSRSTGAWSLAGDADPGALAAFDAFAALKAKGRVFDLGATGTNVNDLWVALRA
jgi:glycerate-2-kinase